MSLDQIIAAMVPPDEPPRRVKRSPLFRGLSEWYEALAPHLDRAEQPYWPGIARRLGERGFVDAEGQPPGGEVLRKTWWKVRRARTGKAGMAPGPVPAGAGPAATSAVAEPPAPPPEPPADEAGLDLTFARKPTKRE